MSATEARPAEEAQTLPPPPPLFDVDQIDALEAIAARRNEQLNGNAPNVAGAQLQGEEPEPPQTVAEPRRRVIKDGLENTFVETKVYGREQEVSLEELQRVYQQDQAAEQKLAHAKELERQLQAELQALAADRQQRQQEQPQPLADISARKQALQTALEKMDYGEEIPDEVITTLFGQPTPAYTPDPAQLAAEVKRQMVIDDATARYAKDFPEIANNDYLDQMTAAHWVELMQQGGLEMGDALMQAAERTRGWIRQMAGVGGSNAAQQSQQTSLAARRREQAQANLANMPHAAPAQRRGVNNPPPPSIEASRRSAIDELMAQQIG